MKNWPKKPMGGYETAKWQIRETFQCASYEDYPCAGLILGSYTVYVQNNGNGTATFAVYDSKTRTSAERDPYSGGGPPAVAREQTKPGGPNWKPFGVDVSWLGLEPGPEGWGGSAEFWWIWTEPIRCSGCK